MDEIVRIFREIFSQLKDKSAKSQVLIGSCSGFIAALASMRIAKSLALIIGGSVLLISVTTDYVWNPRIENVELNLKFAEELIKHNTSLTIGFVAGYLIGFSIV